MKQAITLLFCVTLLLTGCQTQQSGLIRRPSWWERRLDRLDTWNRHNGLPLDKTRDVVVGTGVVVAGAAVIVGSLWLNSTEKKDKNDLSFIFPNNYQ
ncbi:MAG: hypothetical protein U0796_03975 [Gemmatales bacterium]